MSRIVTVKEIEMNDGTKIALPSQGVLAFVGPNNAGKSAALREIASKFGTRHEGGVVVKSIEVEKHASPDQLVTWLSNNVSPVVHPSTGDKSFQTPAGSIREAAMRDIWARRGPIEGVLQSILLFYAGAEQRLTLLNSSPSFDALKARPSTPLQILYSHKHLEESLAETCTSVFGSGVVLNRFAGNLIHLHYGEAPTLPTEVPPSHEYLAELEAIPLVSSQGDGVKSFIGLMLALTASDYPLIVIDEPEAHLHPPQARVIGRQLSAMTPQTKQVFLATHSSDVLQGLLDAPDVPITVVRITRSGSANQFSVLDNDQMKNLWQDPLLRHSDILDGIFHPTTVLCEADTDCRFYRAVEEELAGGPTDTHFAHCGGTSRIAMAFRSLLAVGVDVRIILDLDAMERESLLEDLVTIAGGDWSSLSSDYKVVHAAVKESIKNPTVTYVKEELDRIFSAASGDMTQELKDSVRELTKAGGGWKSVKLGGLTSIPGGADAHNACLRVLEKLGSLGIFLVPVGELERWVPTVSNHGPRWLAPVLENGSHKPLSNQLRDFLTEVTKRN